MPRVLFQAQARAALKAGIDTLAAAVRPTLGPNAGPVALENSVKSRSPELLDDGGAIARRILQLQDRHADVGAMLLRETLWQQKERYGDGAATTAVLYQTVMAAGQKFLSAGGDAMLLRRQLEAGLRHMLADLQGQARPVTGLEAIERLARSICGDRAIAASLADIFEVLGPHSPIEVRAGGRDLRHEFFLGSYWESKVPSNLIFEGAPGERIELRNSAWLISDFELDNLPALVKLVTAVYEAGYASLAIVAKSFSEQIIAAQGANSRMKDFTLVYIEPTGLLDEQQAGLADLALLSGGQVLRTIAGQRFAAVEMNMLGKSELAWLGRNRFGIIAGSGREEAIQAEMAQLERRFARSVDTHEQAGLRGRLGRLRGGAAVIYAGGSSEAEMAYQQERIRRTIAAVRGALLHGVLPGGGSALLRCLEGLEARHAASGDLHARAAYQILMRAAAAPFKALLANAGQEAPGLALEQIRNSANGAGYELHSKKIVDMGAEGPLDSAAALGAALRNGIGGAALALTVATIVHRANPPLAIEPGGLPARTNIGQIELK